MGNSEDGKSTKTEKPPSPAAADQAIQSNQTNIQVYPDWATMQAYYGPRVTMPPYFNSAVASGHAPHPYMWGPPQPMMPPYGAPYATIYSPGAVYAHPPVPMAGTPLSMDTPTKSSGNTDQGFVKKLKGFDGLAMSIGNGKAESTELGTENRPSNSQSGDTEGSSGGSDGNTAGANHTQRKRSREETPSSTDGEGKNVIQVSSVSAKEAGASDKMMSITSASITVKSNGPVVPAGTTTALELTNPKTVAGSVSQPCAIVPSETWLQNERDLKRERRKQSNRESARRSRLRKQAEAEELARKVESLSAENVTLRSEINQLTENSEKLRADNAALMEKLKNAQLGRTGEIVLNSIDGKRIAPVSTENLLSRVNNSSSNDKTGEDETDYRDNKPKSGAKLHQLLDTNPRADAVAAG